MQKQQDSLNKDKDDFINIYESLSEPLKKHIIIIAQTLKSAQVILLDDDTMKEKNI